MRCPYLKERDQRLNEEIFLLRSISHVSKRLAMRLDALAEPCQSKEGGKPYGTSEKSCRYCRRAPRMQ